MLLTLQYPEQLNHRQLTSFLNKEIIIGFTGVPPAYLIQDINSSFKVKEWVDLDTPFNLLGHKIPNFEELLPKITCNIIKTILNNALFFKPDIIIASIGYSKCDTAHFLNYILNQELPQTLIIQIDNLDTKGFGTPISMSNLSLKDKFLKITDGVIPRALGVIDREIQQTLPKAGFWGVPPYDFSILELFPNETHVYGWTRCMENGTPYNMDLEMYVDENVPTVFFSQSFCSKSLLAKELARKHNGLFIEVDGKIDASTRAKIEAFLMLNGVF